MGNTATTANCYFYSQLVYEKGHWTSCFPLLSYRVEARSTDFVKTTTRTGYRYGCSWTGLQLVSTVLAFAIVWKYKHSFCTLPLLTHIQLKESCTEFSVMLPFFFFKAVFVALWFCFFFPLLELIRSEQLFPLKERNYRCAEVQLRYQHRQRQLCSCAHPYNWPENKLRS